MPGRLLGIHWHRSRSAVPGEMPLSHKDITLVIGTTGLSGAEPAEIAEARHFAQGALRAARFLAGQSPGLYSMQDVLS